MYGRNRRQDNNFCKRSAGDSAGLVGLRHRGRCQDGRLSEGRFYTGILGKKNLSKGVKVAVNENVVRRRRKKIMNNYGVIVPGRMREYSEERQKRFGDDDGLSVAAVNIMVEGVNGVRFR